MKWPFVLRSTLDVAQTATAEQNHLYWEWHSKAIKAEREAKANYDAAQQLAAQLARSTEMVNRQADIIAQLTDRLTETAPATPKRSRLTRAIRDQARQPDGTIDRRLLSHFRGEANKLLRQHKKEEDIIESLSTWQTTENADQISVEKIVSAFNDERL